VFTYRLEISYFGNQFKGWQKQSQGERTVQGEFDEALSKIAKGYYSSLAASRTDSGVHALCQIVRVQLQEAVPAHGLLLGLNSLLPPDITVITCREVENDYHPLAAATGKSYQYLFSTRPVDCFEQLWVAQSPYNLDLALMQKAIRSFIGEHDFRAFQCQGTPVDSTIRKITAVSLRAELFRIHPLLPEREYLSFCVEGEGFLKQMVRLMVGAIWSIGLQKSSIEDLEEALKSGSSQRLGIVAPASGLYLVKASDHFSDS